MKHLKTVNQKAVRIEQYAQEQAAPVQATDEDVVALQRTGPPQQPHIPLGCSGGFSPGWEADRTGGTAGAGRPARRHDPGVFTCPA